MAYQSIPHSANTCRSIFAAYALPMSGHVTEKLQEMV